MPRYVILEHDHPGLHWDFMLEAGDGLRTWRLTAPPTAGRIIAATPLGSHRLAYLDYEGPVSGERGTVTQWDRGVYEEVLHSDDSVVVRIEGRRLCGTATLARVGEEWSLQFRCCTP